MSVHEYLDGPWPVVGVVRLAVFQLQIVVADVIMVFSPISTLPHYLRSLIAHQQVYRVFHIYDRNPRVYHSFNNHRSPVL